MAYRNPYQNPYIAQHLQSRDDLPPPPPPEKPQQEFNPYVDNYQPDQGGAQGYDYRGYQDEPAIPEPRYNAAADVLQPRLASGGDVDVDSMPSLPSTKVKEEMTVRALKRYRYDVQGNLWRKGGRGRCFGRFCCCSILVVLFLFISILLAMALWIRPPNINIGGVSPSGQPIGPTSDGGLTINLNVGISVANPNYFTVSFKDITADIIYPIDNTNIGTGSEGSITFPSRTSTTFVFPFAIKYQRSLDPDNKILVDLATKCGILGGSQSDITVNYKITLGLRVLFVVISPTISNSFSFACPLSASDLSGLLQEAGISIPGTGS